MDKKEEENNVHEFQDKVHVERAPNEIFNKEMGERHSRDSYRASHART